MISVRTVDKYKYILSAKYPLKLLNFITNFISKNFSLCCLETSLMFEKARAEQAANYACTKVRL